MEYVITINLDNAAFYDDGMDDVELMHNPGPEVARLLRKLADECDGGPYEGKLKDINGNTVGRAEIRTGE